MDVEETMADRLVSQIYQRFCEALNDASRKRLNKLGALAYADRRNERWIVMETYARVFRDWDLIVDTVASRKAAAQWDAWMELPFPSSNCCFDMGFTLREGDKSARSDTPVIQFKIVFGGQKSKEPEGRNAVSQDAGGIIGEGMINGYIFVLHVRWPDENREGKRVWLSASARDEAIAGQKKRLLEAVPNLKPVGVGTHYECKDWGPFVCKLSEDSSGRRPLLWTSCEYTFFAQGFRVLRPT
jgi:hypothetical protein